MFFRRSLEGLFALSACLCAANAHASASKWEHAEGGSVRVVIASAPDKDGNLAGILQIRLKPGWKTYWRDPGDAGVPPTLEIASGGGAVAVQMDYPAPRRFDDGYSVWAGYDSDVSFPFTLAAGQAKEALSASVFIGICETICVPLQARLDIGSRTAEQQASDATAIAAALAALPKPAQEGFAASIVAADKDKLTVEAQLPADASKAELFVAATQSHTFEEPELVSQEAGKAVFSVPLLDPPEDDGGQQDAIHYTLVTDDDAVSGVLTFRR